MAYAFDTLTFTKTLEAAGVPRNVAEAHAAAARDFIMADLVTKADLRDAMERLTLSLTIRLGGVMAAGLGILAALLKIGA